MDVEEKSKSSLEFRRGRAAGRDGEPCFTWVPLACVNRSGVDAEEAGLAVHIVLLSAAVTTDDTELGDQVLADGVFLTEATSQFFGAGATRLGCQKELDSKIGSSIFRTTGAVRLASPLSVMMGVAETLPFDQSNDLLLVVANQLRLVATAWLGCQKELDSNTGNSAILATGALRTASPASFVSSVVARGATAFFDQSMVCFEMLGADEGIHIACWLDFWVK